jgi:hypothetical protein
MATIRERQDGRASVLVEVHRPVTRLDLSVPLAAPHAVTAHKIQPNQIPETSTALRVGDRA